MVEEIYMGHDCSKEAKVTTRTSKETGEVTYYHRALNLERTHIIAGFGETVMLKLLHSHADCDDVCYEWIQLLGGGYLIEDHGPEVGYVMPDKNKECENSATISVYYGRKRLDTAYISSTQTTRLYDYQRVPVYSWPTEPANSWLLGDIAYGVMTSEIRADKHSGGSIQIGPGRWRLADENLEAVYVIRCYDCAGNFMGKRKGPGVRWPGTEPPIDKCKEKFSDQVGRIYDYRTKEMKIIMCCPPKLVEKEFKIIRGY